MPLVVSGMRGSSPLARGLPPVPHLGGSVLVDHPRSRGVYGLIYAWNNSETGSSPLARGLPRPVDAGDVPVGIIPARAGFTLGVTD